MAPSLLFFLPDAGAVEQETSMNRFVSVCGMALGIGGGAGDRLAGRDRRRPVRSCARWGVEIAGPQRTGVYWPRATGKVRRGFSGRSTGHIFWSTRSHRLRIRK